MKIENRFSLYACEMSVENWLPLRSFVMKIAISKIVLSLHTCVMKIENRFSLHKLTCVMKVKVENWLPLRSFVTEIENRFS